MKRLNSTQSNFYLVPLYLGILFGMFACDDEDSFQYCCEYEVQIGNNWEYNCDCYEHDSQETVDASDCSIFSTSTDCYDGLCLTTYYRNTSKVDECSEGDVATAPMNMTPQLDHHSLMCSYENMQDIHSKL